MNDEWQPIETLPDSGQALVTDDDPTERGSRWPGYKYSTIELINCPMLSDGRVLNANSGNYSRAGAWKWWRPVPRHKFAGYAELTEV